MLTSVDQGAIAEISYACLSTDDKPEGADNGELLIEIDTSTLYVFDAEGGTWRAWS